MTPLHSNPCARELGGEKSPAGRKILKYSPHVKHLRHVLTSLSNQPLFLCSFNNFYCIRKKA